MVHGCLVKKALKITAKSGKRYAVRMISNIPTHARGKITQPLTSVNYLVFDDEFKKLNTQVKGIVFALRKPQILPPRETIGSRRLLRVRMDVSWCLEATLKLSFGVATAEESFGDWTIRGTQSQMTKLRTSFVVVVRRPCTCGPAVSLHILT